MADVDLVTEDRLLVEDMMVVENLLTELNIVHLIKDNLILELLRNNSNDRNRVHKVVNELIELYGTRSCDYFMNEADDDILLNLNDAFVSDVLGEHSGGAPDNSNSRSASNVNPNPTANDFTDIADIVPSTSREAVINIPKLKAPVIQPAKFKVTEPTCSTKADRCYGDSWNMRDYRKTSGESSSSSNSDLDVEEIIVPSDGETVKRRTSFTSRSPLKKSKVQVVDLVAPTGENSFDLNKYMDMLQAMFPDADPAYLQREFSTVEDEMELNLAAVRLLESNEHRRVLGNPDASGPVKPHTSSCSSSVILKPSLLQLADGVPGACSSSHADDAMRGAGDVQRPRPGKADDDLLETLFLCPKDSPMAVAANETVPPSSPAMLPDAFVPDTTEQVAGSNPVSDPIPSTCTSQMPPAGPNPNPAHQPKPASEEPVSSTSRPGSSGTCSTSIPVLLQASSTSAPGPSQMSSASAPGPSQMSSSSAPGPSQMSSSSTPGPSQMSSSSAPGPSQMSSSSTPKPSQTFSLLKPGLAQTSSTSAPGPSQMSSTSASGPSQTCLLSKPGLAQASSAPRPPELSSTSAPGPSQMSSASAPGPSQASSIQSKSSEQKESNRSPLSDIDVAAIELPKPQTSSKAVEVSVSSSKTSPASGAANPPSTSKGEKSASPAKAPVGEAGPSGLNSAEKAPSPWAEKQALLLSILPDADPTYLELKASELFEKEEEFKTFVADALEKKDYPTMKDYLRSQEMIEMQNKYLKDFSIETFLEIVPEPFKYFSEAKRTSTKDSFQRGLLFLKRKYRLIRSNDISAVYTKYDFNLTKTCHCLDKFKGVPLKRGRPEFKIADKLPLSNTSLQFLQEVAFIENEKKIRQYLEDKENEEKRAFEEAKAKGELLECNCCYDDEVLARNITTCSEGHTFCKACVRKGAETKIGEGSTTFSCLTTCNGEFSLQVLQGVLKPTVFSKLAQRKQVEEIKAAGIEDLVQCPFCDFCNIPSAGDKVFRCLNPDCMKDSCIMCKEESHIPFKCNEVERASEVKMRTYIEDKMTEALVRTCWKCQRKFVKIDGCNKMTCQCGALMCYICRQPVKDYSHFNGQGGEEYHKCPLFSDNNSVHAEAVERVAAQAKAELALKHPGVTLRHDPTSVPIPREAGGQARVPHVAVPRVAPAAGAYQMRPHFVPNQAAMMRPHHYPHQLPPRYVPHRHQMRHVPPHLPLPPGPLPPPGPVAAALNRGGPPMPHHRPPNAPPGEAGDRWQFVPLPPEPPFPHIPPPYEYPHNFPVQHRRDAAFNHLVAQLRNYREPHHH